MSFGNTLRDIRKLKQLTLKELAGMTELSTAYLSKLENDLSSPTLANLQKICEALKITMAELIDEKPKEQPRVVRRESRYELFVTGSGVVYRLLHDQPGVKITSMTIQHDNYNTEMSWGHHDDELGIVAEGSLTITIGEESHTLYPGDFICVKAHEVHQYVKAGEGPCTVYWIYVMK